MTTLVSSATTVADRLAETRRLAGLTTRQMAQAVGSSQLVALRQELEAAIVVAVQGQRSYGRSWAYIGAALGMKRQSAQERYGERVAS